MSKKLLFVAGLAIAIVVGVFSYIQVEADDVTVSATVADSVSCSTATSTTSFGTLTTGSISTSAPNVTSTMSCNYGAGCTLSVADAGNTTNPGLWNSAESDLVQSSTATLSAGTEGYGIQATTTGAGSGGTLTVATTYDKSGSNVGGLTLGGATLISSSLPIGSREVVVTHKAAIGILTAGGSYADTITYSCTGN